MATSTNVKVVGKLPVDKLVSFIKEKISQNITISIEEEEQFFDTKSDIVFSALLALKKRDVGWIHL